MDDQSEAPERQTDAVQAPSEAASAPSEQAPPPTETAPAPSGQVVDDANDLRGFHFKRLMRKTLTWVLTIIFVIAAAVAGAIFVGPVIGLAAAVGVFLLAVLIVFVIADSAAEKGFFETYAEQREMRLTGRRPLPPATPLLRKGDDRYADRSLEGPLAEGVDGILALYTYEDESYDSEGNRQTNYYHYTVGLCDIPECVDHVPELYCQRKFGFKALEGLEDVFRSKERVNLESAKLEDEYEIFAGKGQDAVWLRRFFSPSFIVWMIDSAPKKFAFELVNGTLCCYVKGHSKEAAKLDIMRAATASVTGRLRDESGETGHVEPAAPAPAE
jgi:hypothetical protein